MQQLKEIAAREGVTLFKALGSTTRVKILELLAVKEMNINELAMALHLAQPSVTKHVQILEEAGLVASDYSAAPQGTQKRCRRTMERLVVDLGPPGEDEIGFAESELPVGMYTDAHIVPTCGLATKEKFIGLLDSPLSFFLPERSQAEIIWSSGGWVEYSFPNTMPLGTKVRSMELMMEVSSEFPGYNNHYPSDVTVWINGIEIGTWTSPGDFGGTRGHLNPTWYPDNFNQWGLMKTWLVEDSGSSVDGVRLTTVSIDDLQIRPWEITKVRIGVKEDSTNQGGFTLFGNSFGNYQMGLVFRLRFDPEVREEPPAKDHLTSNGTHIGK